jgi:hypothetical protein
MRLFTSHRLWLGLLLTGSVAAHAQVVPQAVVVEHFTNTRCSICVSRNPGFYTNLRQQPPGTLHLAYHPSAPYRLCLFSQQNPTENDARTNFYGIYGSTPRLVVNGRVIPAAQNYADPAVFAPAQGLVSPLAVQVGLAPFGADSLIATLRIQTVAPHALTGLTYYLALAEDTVFYAAPNGETVHPNVFRRSFTGPDAVAFTPPAVGSTLTIRRTIVRQPDWLPARLYALAFVQQTGGLLVQASASQTLGSAPLGVPAPVEATVQSVYPNPVRETLHLAVELSPGTPWQALNLLGQEVASGQLASASLDVRACPSGIYILRVGGQRAVRFQKE